jgi:hypothetical protein
MGCYPHDCQSELTSLCIGGSLDLYLQHESPGLDNVSNWLPAPEGEFRVTLRMYQPLDEVLDGSFTLPPIRQVG